MLPLHHCWTGPFVELSRFEHLDLTCCFKLLAAGKEQLLYAVDAAVLLRLLLVPVQCVLLLLHA